MIYKNIVYLCVDMVILLSTTILILEYIIANIRISHISKLIDIYLCILDKIKPYEICRKMYPYSNLYETILFFKKEKNSSFY